MYIDHISRKPSIRETTRFDVVQAKNVNVKKLKMLDKQAANEYINAKFHGGRLYLGRGFGSWLKRSFRKVGNFAKNTFNKVIKPAYTKIVKPGLNFLTKTELGKQITNGASTIIGSAVSALPVVGPVAGPVVQKTLPTVLNAADDITTAAEQTVQAIKDKNPQLTISQGKQIVNTIKNTYNALNDEMKAVKKEQTKEVFNKLPETVKAEGFEAVMKAAPFLPLLDLTTLKQDETQTKGGKLKITFKVRKPTKAEELTKAKYSAPIVSRVAGRMFIGGACSTAGACGKSEVKPKIQKNKNMELLESLRKKYSK